MDQKIYIHSQSDEIHSHTEFNTHVSLGFEGDYSEQAFSTRAFNLLIHDLIDGKSSTFVTDVEIPADYLELLSELGIGIPADQIVVLENSNASLTKNALAQLERLKEKGKGIRSIASVFTPTLNEIQLMGELACVAVPEFSIETWGLVNKGFQHVMLSEDIEIDGIKVKLRHNSEMLELSKLENLQITSPEDLTKYLKGKYANNELFFKHPFSTAGAGLWTNQHIDIVYDLIQKNNLIVVEQLFENSTEHSLHFRIDPITKEYSFIGTYDQLVEDNGLGGFAHEGCVFPSKFENKAKFLETIGPKIAENLSVLGVTGDMCLDVLVRENDDKNLEVHVMEINPRTGANLYALRFAQAVMKSKFGLDTDPNFELKAGVKLDANSVTELFAKYPGLKDLAQGGKILLSNYGRFEFGKWDVIFLSPESAEDVELVKQKFNNLVYVEA